MMNVKNKGCIRRLSWRSLWAARKRNFIAIIAIILTTLLFTSLFTVAMSIYSTSEQYRFRQIGSTRHGAFAYITEEQANQISGHDNVKESGRRIPIGAIDNECFGMTPVEVSYMDTIQAKWSFAEATTGHNPKSGKEITMSTKALKQLGIEPKLGAQISLTFMVNASSEVPFEKTDTFTLVGWWEHDGLSPIHYINVSQQYAKEIEAEAMAQGSDSFRIELSVMMRSGRNIQTQMEQVAKDLGYSWDKAGDGPRVAIAVNSGYTASQLRQQIDPSTVLAIVAILALVIFTGYLIIYNIFQISVTGDIRFYGLLKSIGVTPRQLRRIIRQQALFLCGIGIPVGLLLGYGIGAGITPMVLNASNLGLDTSTISTSPLIFLAAALFALITVLLSCSRPGKIASKVSPVEATRYTDATPCNKKKGRTARGAKVHHMAFANLGRNKTKTTLVVISLAFSVVLFNILVTFTQGFDMEKYLNGQSCSDFIVSSKDYFRVSSTEEYLSEAEIAQIKANTIQSLSGCGYTINGNFPVSWMSEETWQKLSRIESMAKPDPNALIPGDVQIEGLDKDLWKKVSVVKGDLSPILQGNKNTIAMVLTADENGKIESTECIPAVGSTLTITYVDEAYFIDSRTGKPSDESTPAEYATYHIAKSHDVTYTIAAHVTVPNAMSHRYLSDGYRVVMPVEQMRADSQQEVIPMFYLFDTPDEAAEKAAERYLADLTNNNQSTLMYESKATHRTAFKDFQSMFLLLGGLLCAIIAFIGILNFFNAVMTGILSRKREFAVLQSVGMTNRQLRTMLIYEGLFYAISSALIALVLSLVLGPVIGVLFEKVFWFYRANFTILPVLLSIPVFALLGFAIPYMMYGKTAKQSIVERLREATT